MDWEKDNMKNRTIFECIECGYQSPKYYGKCPQCQNWNSMVEIKPGNEESQLSNRESTAVRLKDIEESKARRNNTGLTEFDRVLGGGIVPDSVILIGGEPGVGKSTLLLEVSGILTRAGQKVLYYSGEESAHQIKIRANRLNIDSDDLYLLTMGTLENLKKSASDLKPEFLMIDSIQTIHPGKNSLI
ncbi:MAG: AAA family ATPase, partial [Candidatus Aminicenantes bacterium]|nr:AAA family ATPase [Candidatus Aminicenantes bacterium]